MSKTFNLPNFRHIRFINNVQTGYFTKSTEQPELTATQTIPFELMREKTVKGTINAEYSLFKHLYKDNHSKVMFTGLQPSRGFKNWYIGNNYRQKNGVKILELLLIFIASKNDRMHVFYFPEFYKITDSLRQRYATDIIPTLENKINEFESK